jgi:hypothetical protein
MGKVYVFCGITVLLLITFSAVKYAVAQDNVNFSTYTNPIYGITLQYPSDWDVIPNVGNASGYNVLARFIPNSLESSNSF